MNTREEETIEIVNKQLEYYNERDYDSFSKCYHRDISSYDLSSGMQILEMSGYNFFRHYENKFKENPTLHCKIIERIFSGNLVIDKELISNFNGKSHNEVVIYQVENQLISKMWFQR